MEIVGANIRRLRKKQNYSLREFGNKVGVSASFLSQVEVGKISPSLSKLKDIADALNTTIGLLIGETDHNSYSPVIRKKDRKLVDRLGTGINVELLSLPDPYKQMEPFILKMQPNATSGSKQHQHYGQVFIYVFKGKLKISLNNKDYLLNEEDSIYFNSNIPHAYANVDKNITEALWIVTPPTF
jgi:transcriptional regulator with XRE-family HTH domain